MIKKELKYSYNDVSIVPAKVSGIDHRGECNPFIYNDVLPLFTAPMSSIVNEVNRERFMDNGIIPILPRSINLNIRLDYTHRGKWSAYSLKETSENFLGDNNFSFSSKPFPILIDIANGHMSCLYDLVYKLREQYGELLTIMLGNIANPETYEICEKFGVNYVRVGIGSGRGCITSSNVSVHYPMASLIEETFLVKSRIGGKCKIIADGGVRNYSDVIKALALGADYVMVGSVFSKMLESAAPVENEEGYTIPNKDITYIGGGKFTIGDEEAILRKHFYGMASGLGQIAIGGKKTKTAEGIDMYLPVEYTISSWVENFKDYLRSAMSYTGAHNLEEFIGKPDLVVISENTYQSVNK